MRIFFDMDGVIFHFLKGNDYMKKGYFYNLPVYETMVNYIKALNNLGYEIFICSKYPTPYAKEEKLKSLVELFPWFKLENIILVPYEDNKVNHIKNITYNDILIDDYTPNLLEWEACGGHAIKCLNGINNTTRSWKGETINVFKPRIVA